VTCNLAGYCEII